MDLRGSSRVLRLPPAVGHFFFLYVARSSAGVREKDRMIYFMLRLFGREGKKTQVGGSPREPPYSLPTCEASSLRGQVLHGAKHRSNDVSVFPTGATHAGSQSVRGRRPARSCRDGYAWKGVAAGGERQTAESERGARLSLGIWCLALNPRSSRG